MRDKLPEYTAAKPALEPVQADVAAFYNGNILTRNFQQPSAENLKGMINIKEEKFGSFVVYPNPAVDNLSYVFHLP